MLFECKILHHKQLFPFVCYYYYYYYYNYYYYYYYDHYHHFMAIIQDSLH